MIRGAGAPCPSRAAAADRSLEREHLGGRLSQLVIRDRFLDGLRAPLNAHLDGGRFRFLRERDEGDRLVSAIEARFAFFADHLALEDLEVLRLEEHEYGEMEEECGDNYYDPIKLPASNPYRTVIREGQHIFLAGPTIT